MAEQGLTEDVQSDDAVGSDHINPGEDPNSEDSDVDTQLDAASELTPAIFSTADVKRVFRVGTSTSTGTSWRPSFLLAGSVEESSPGGAPEPVQPEASTGSAISSNPGLAGGGTPAAGDGSEESSSPNLDLSIRYEPPSAKFVTKHPGCVSYRLKVSQQGKFLWSLRGLSTQASLAGSTLSWGSLILEFSSSSKASKFASMLKHVEIQEQGADGDAEQNELGSAPSLHSHALPDMGRASSMLSQPSLHSHAIPEARLSLDSRQGSARLSLDNRQGSDVANVLPHPQDSEAGSSVPHISRFAPQPDKGGAKPGTAQAEIAEESGAEADLAEEVLTEAAEDARDGEGENGHPAGSSTWVWATLGVGVLAVTVFAVYKYRAQLNLHNSVSTSK